MAQAGLATKTEIFLDKTSCRLTESYRRFEEACSLHVQCVHSPVSVAVFPLKLIPAKFSETPITILKYTVQRTKRLEFSALRL